MPLMSNHVDEPATTTAPTTAVHLQSIGDSLPEQPATLCNDSDIANAREFYGDWREHVMYIHSHKTWSVWDGRRWREDDRGVINEHAKSTAARLYQEALDLPTDSAPLAERRKQRLKHTARANNVNGYSAMLTAAQSMPSLAVTVHELDANPWLFNAQNGCVDLQNLDFHESRRADRITKVAGVSFDFDATAPRWAEFLRRIFDGNDHLINYIRRAIGYSLTGLTSEQCFFMLYGTGANGKSTFLNVVSRMLGDYSSQTPFETILQRKYESDGRSDLAALVGSRLVRASEGDKGRRLAESVVKLLTGEDSVTVRKLYGHFFTYRPEFKLWLATNHKPRIGGNDHGIWRRIRVIPFTVQIPDSERDTGLEGKLVGELPGIFNWALVGLMEWMDSGLGVPSEIADAVETYQTEEDLLGQFILEHCECSDTLQCFNKALYEKFCEWCESQGEVRRTGKWMSGQLIERGYRQSRAASGRIWHGLQIKSTSLWGVP